MEAKPKFVPAEDDRWRPPKNLLRSHYLFIFRPPKGHRLHSIRTEYVGSGGFWCTSCWVPMAKAPAVENGPRENRVAGESSVSEGAGRENSTEEDSPGYDGEERSAKDAGGSTDNKAALSSKAGVSGSIAPSQYASLVGVAPPGGFSGRGRSGGTKNRCEVTVPERRSAMKGVFFQSL